MKRDQSRAIGLVVAALGMAAMMPQVSHAALVAFDFSGIIVLSQDSSDLLSGGFKAGDAFSGQVIYDTSKVQAGPPGVYYFFESGTITFTSGGHTFTGSTAVSSQSCWPSPVNCIEPFNVAAIDNGAAEGDRLAYSAAYLTYDGQTAPGSPARSLLQLQLRDSSQSALSSNALPTAPPDLAAFNWHRVTLSASGPDLMAPLLYYVDGEVTMISAPSAVPEPGTMALFLAGFVGLIHVSARGRKLGTLSTA